MTNDNFWDKEEEIATLSKGRGSEYRISKVTLKKREFISLREWTEDTAGEMRPTRKGVAIPMDLAEQVGAAVLKGSGAVFTLESEESSDA